MTIQSIYDSLSNELGLHWPSLGRVQLSGADPVIDSVFRIGEATAAVLGVQAAAIAEIWARRGGSPQLVKIDATAGALAAFSVGYQSQHGYAIPQPEPSYPLVALYPARDGRWIMLHGAFPLLRNGLLELLGCSMEPASIAAKVAQWDAFALEEAIAAQGLCGVVARSRAEWAATPQGQALAVTPLIEITRIGDAPARPFPPGPRPLSGINILDLTHVIAGPTIGKTMAEQGATVLHVTTPTEPVLPPFDYDTGHGKYAAYLNLTVPHDAETLRGLCKDADLFVQSFRPGALGKLGFGPSEVAALRPGIIYVSVDCYGSTGPWASRPGWEQLAQVATGMAVTQGTPQQPALQTVYPNDYATGFLGALGAEMALLRREREGGSWLVRVSLCRTAMWLQDQGEVDRSQLPPPPIPQPAIDRHLRTEPSALGPLTFLGPVLDYEVTPSWWDRQTVPLGADPAAWPIEHHATLRAAERQAVAPRRHAAGLP